MAKWISDAEFQFSVESSMNIQHYKLNPIETQPPCTCFSARRKTQYLPFTSSWATHEDWGIKQGANRSAATKPSAKRKRT